VIQAGILEWIIEQLEGWLQDYLDHFYGMGNLNNSIYDNANIIYIFFTKVSESPIWELIIETCDILLFLFSL
jgi:hypothetical protein